MHTKSKKILFGLLILLIFDQCRTKTGAAKSDAATNPAAEKIVTSTKFDTIIQQLKSISELTKEDILELKVIDTSYVNASGETCYCDTTVQLNDSIFYSIIDLPDQSGICTHTFILTVDEKNKKAIASKYLEPGCDIDYSWDSYELYDHKIIFKDKIQLTKITIFQKKKRVSNDEEQNIDHKETQNSYLVISPAGQIKLTNK